MANSASILLPRTSLRASLMTLPMALWSLVIFSPGLRAGSNAQKLATLLVLAFTTSLFFLMLRSGKTYHYRRIFFVSLGFLFPVGFITELVMLRGSMSLPMESVLGGNAPFCAMAIPMTLVPAALKRILVFPGAILPTASNPNAFAPMVAVWFLAMLIMGRGWCSMGCFFGGIEEGFASILKKPKVKRFPGILKLLPWAVLLFIVLLSALSLSSTYCAWLCPFKAVTEFAKIRNVVTALQFIIPCLLFATLVVILPLLSRKRTQCALFCPFGAFQSLIDKVHPVQIRVDREKCKDCMLCEKACTNLALDSDCLKSGKPGSGCVKCGACVDACKSGAVRYHVRGTSLSARAETARLFFLYSGWCFATMFGGSILVSSLATVFHLI